jgi:hypothetical protein
MPGSTVNTAEDYMAEYICAELPEMPNDGDKSEAAIRQRLLCQIIEEKNIHTCSRDRCLVDGKCKKRFPVSDFLIINNNLNIR